MVKEQPCYWLGSRSGSQPPCLALVLCSLKIYFDPPCAVKFHFKQACLPSVYLKPQTSCSIPYLSPLIWPCSLCSDLNTDAQVPSHYSLLLSAPLAFPVLLSPQGLCHRSSRKQEAFGVGRHFCPLSNKISAALDLWSSPRGEKVVVFITMQPCIEQAMC